MARTLLNAEQINTVSFETKVETAVTTGTSSDDLVQKTGDIMSGTLTVPTLEVDGNQIIFNSSTTGAPASDAFITAERGSSTDAFLKWDETNDQWVTNFKLAVDSDIRVTGGIQFDDSISGDSELALYKGGTGFFIMRRYAADYTILQIWAPSETWFNPYEATLSLVRGNEPNQEFIDLYNNGYPTESQYGIRMQKRGTGSYRDFIFDYYDGNTKLEVMKLHSDQSVDFIGNVDIGGSLSGVDSDDIPEGSTNKYFSGKTTDDLSEGSTNKYFNGKTTDDLSEGSTNKYFNGKTTDDLSEGSTNKYFSGKTLDDLPDGTSYVKLNKTTQTVYGDKTFNDKILDKNGNEVIAMQVETKQNTASIAADSYYDVVVSGFSFNPTGVLVAYACCTDAGFGYFQCSIGGGGGGGSSADTPHINSITLGTNSVTVQVFNDHTSSHNFAVIVTAVATS